MTATQRREPADTELQPLVADSYAALAEALETLSEDRWSEPSRCEGWTVRNVVAHLTMAVRYPGEAFMAELAKDGFDFQAMSDRLAAEGGKRPTAELIAGLRSETMATFPMPDGGFLGSLTHVVIHGLDVTVPLGLGRSSSDDATRLVLDALVADSPNMFGVVPQPSLCTSDVAWSWREGAAADHTAAELILMLSGRRI